VGLDSESEPFVACTYGPSGVGKTTDNGYSFPNALFLAAPGALTSITKTCGYTPTSASVATIEDAIAVIEKLKGTKYDTVVIDDFSFMAEQTFSALEQDKRYSGFKLWGKMRDVALKFRDKSRYCGINVVLNCWEQPPKSKTDGSRVRGGPQLSGKLPESIPALCDVVLQVQHENMRKPWPYVYRGVPNPSYVRKDRYNVASNVDPAPMNLAELLRAGGVHVSRHEAISEELVQELSEAFTGNPANDVALANEVFATMVGNGRAAHHARWIVRDALDRALIRGELDKQNTSFFG